VYLTCSKKLTGSQLSLPHGVVHLFNKIVQQNQSGALTNSIRTVIRTGAAEPVQCAVRTDTAVKRRDVIIPWLEMLQNKTWPLFESRLRHCRADHSSHFRSARWNYRRVIARSDFRKALVRRWMDAFNSSSTSSSSSSSPYWLKAQTTDIQVIFSARIDIENLQIWTCTRPTLKRRETFMYD